MQITEHVFSANDVVAGHPVLDFANTVTARNTDTPLDWLDSYARLTEWAGLVQLLEPGVLKILKDKAATEPSLANAALTRARMLREAIYAVVTALIGGRPIDSRNLEIIDKGWKRAQSRTELVVMGPRLEASLNVRQSGLDLIADTLAVAAIDLLTHYPVERTRLCPGDRCGWVFIDTSKGGHRVWCDMRTCGNVAKARRHYHAKRQG